MKRSIFLSIGIAVTTIGFCSAKVVRDDLTCPHVRAQSHILEPGIIYELLKNNVTASIEALQSGGQINLNVYAYAAAFLELYPTSQYPQFTELATQTMTLLSHINPDADDVLDDLKEDAYENLKAHGF